MTYRMGWLLISAVGFAVFLAIKTENALAVGSTCRASDSDALVLRSYIRELVASTSPDRVAVRNSLGLKSMDSTRVNFVADNRVCDKVATGLNTELRTPNLGRSLYVVSVGTDYAAQDPDHPSGEYWPTVSLDNKFKVKGVVLAP